MKRGDLSPTRTHKVPLTAVSSGARLADLFPLPLAIFIPMRVIRWLIRRWWITVSVAAYVYLGWQYTALTLLVLVAAVYGWLWMANRRHGPMAILRASKHLLRARLAWKTACENAELNLGPKRPKLGSLFNPPKIADKCGNSLTFIINLARVHLTVKDLEDVRDYVAASLNARRTRVIRLTPGVASLTLEWEKNVHKSVVANPTNQINATQLPRVELDQDVLLELDTSLLVVGESGSGKSNLTWFILNSLNLNSVPHRDYVLDPKKVELADLVHGRYTRAYADTPTECEAVIEKFHADMMTVFTRMKADGIRRIEISDKNPLHILIADELLLLRIAQAGVDSPLGEILSAGRAAGFIVLANSQLGQVDAISRLRDLFPQRVCMATKSSDLTNAVLGPRAEERGARCTEITEKGVGYIFTDHHGSFQRFKPPFIDDAGIRKVAEGIIWKAKKATGSKIQFRK